MNIYTTILVEFLFLTTSILLLFRLRSKLGLAPLYIILGAIQCVQAFSGTSIHFVVLGKYTVYPASIIIFSTVLFAVLLIYILEGVKSARALIIGVIISNLILTALFGITYVQEIILRLTDDYSTKAVFILDYKYFIAGTTILLFDFILMVVLYQFLISKVKSNYFFLTLFIALGSVLIFDAFAFNLILKYNAPDFSTSLIGHVIGKTVMAFVLSITLYVYIKYLDSDHINTDFIPNQDRDVFSILKYRKKYKNLKVEKAEVEKALVSKLESTLNKISDGFVSLDTDWCYTFVNKKASEFLGKTPKRLLGKHIWTEFPEGKGLPFYKAYHHAVETQKTQFLQEYYEPDDKWYENRIYPSSDGLMIYITDITEQKKSELALKESENYLRTVLETDPECIKQLNAKGEFIYINPAGLAMIEADTLETVKGKSVLNFISPNHLDAFKRLLVAVFEGNSGQLVFELKGLKGAKKWLEIQAVPFKNIDGNIISFLGVTRDITNRKEAEDQIIKNENLFRNLTSSAPVAIFQTDKEGACNYVNEEWIKYTGIPFMEAMGYGWSNAIHAEDKERVMHEWQEALQNGKEFVSELRFQHKNSQITWLSAKAVGTYNAQNKLYGYIGMALDISNQKRAEKLLKENREYLDNIINNIGDPVFVKDDQSHFILANDAFYSLFNRTKEETLGRTFADDVPIAERKRYLSIDNQVISEGVENVDEDSFEGEGGETRYISTKKTRFIDDNGNKFLIGIIRDITKLKKAENRLIENKIYLDNIINNIGDPVFVKDEESRLLIVNDAFCELFNLNRTDVLGKTLAENVSPEEREIFIHFDKQVITTGVENINEETLTISGKESQIISTKKTRFIDANGNKYLIGVSRNITKRKKTEIELEKYRNHLEELVKIRTEEINLKNDELQRMNKLFVGRELRMRELKNIIKEKQLKNDN